MSERERYIRMREDNKTIDRLEAEIVELRAALQRIDDSACPYCFADSIARETLTVHAERRKLEGR